MPEVTLTITAQTQQAQAALNNLNSSITGTGKVTSGLRDKFKAAVSGMKDVQATFQMAGQAFNSVKRVLEDLVGGFVEYADQVRDMSRATGASTEQTSKLIQAADDAFVSYESLSVAMRRAIQQGIDPSLEGMAKLSDQYLAIQDPIKRSQFLIETFGRSGLEMGKLLEKGGDEIRKMGDEAERVGLVLSTEDVKAAEDFKKAQDALNDTLEGAKITLGKGLLPIIIEFIDIVTGAVEVVLNLGKSQQELRYEFVQTQIAIAGSVDTYEEYITASREAIVQDTNRNTVMGGLVRTLDDQEYAQAAVKKGIGFLTVAQFKQAKAIEKVNQQFADGYVYGEDYVKSLWNVTSATDDQTAAVDALRASMETSVEDENRRFIESQTKIRDEMDEVKGRIDELNKKKYLTQEQKDELQTLYDKHRDLAGQYANTATEHEKATAKIIFDIYYQKAAMDGVVDDIELAALAAYAKTSGLISESQAAVLAAANEDWETLKARYSEMDGTVIDVYYQTHLTGQTPPRAAQGDVGLGSAPVNYGNVGNAMPIYNGAQAAGGQYTVSQPTVFIAGDRGTEQVSFRPGGNTYNFYTQANAQQIAQHVRILQEME